MNPLQRGQVYLLRPGSDGKQRPVVIVSRDELNGDSVPAIPFYSQQLDRRKRMKWCVLFKGGEAGLSRDCVAKCDEISLVDKAELDQITGSIGRVGAVQLDGIVKAVRYAIRDDSLTAP